MAAVLLARDPRHNRELALKLFRPEVSAALADERFEREIQVVARLNHPHIVPLFDSGACAGYLYYVMPLVRGESLRQRMDREGRFELAVALRLTIEICGALDYAHRHGVVHRDIKPENILLSEGHALVTDFGIAHAIDSAAGHRLTSIGMTLGTPAYLSPEQAGGESTIDGRSDQYSLACVLFELLTGTTPFTGPGTMALLAQHLSQLAPSLVAVRPEVPELVERVVHRALEKLPADRFASAADMAVALEGASIAASTGAVVDSIVVLDFLNISGAPSVQWLSGGIAETVGVDLKRAGTVRMVRGEKVARALAARQRPVASEDDALQVARSLGARWVVWGGYQAMGDRIRITPHIGDVQAGAIVSTSKLDGSMNDVFAMQDRIVEDVLTLLSVNVSEHERAMISKPPTTSLTAYELFARARQLQRQFTPAALVESRQLLHQAIERDPDYALAHSGLGFSYAFAFIGTSSPDDLTSALTHLHRATTLDAGLGEAHAWLAYALGRAGRIDEAVVSSERAVALEPDFPLAHYFFAIILYSSTEFGADRWERRGRAVHELLTATRLEPGSQSSYHGLADLYLANGQYDDALAPVKKAMEIESGIGRTGIEFIGAFVLDGVLAFRTRDLERARQQFDRAVEGYAGSQHLYAQVHLAMAHRGLGEVALRRENFDDALISANRAIRICRAHPRHAGMGFTLVRAHLLAAKASFALGVSSEARAELAEAERLLRERTGYAFVFLYEANVGIAAFDCASTYALAGKFDEAMIWLERAWNACWNDHPSIAADPSFARMLGQPALTEFIERCRNRSRHPAPGALSYGTPS
jgi:tetratricopeptide (TPR) repeat protein/TolB-like protein